MPDKKITLIKFTDCFHKLEKLAHSNLTVSELKKRCDEVCKKFFPNTDKRINESVFNYVISAREKIYEQAFIVFSLFFENNSRK